jgi:hypothetical protein
MTERTKYLIGLVAEKMNGKRKFSIRRDYKRLVEEADKKYKNTNGFYVPSYYNSAYENVDGKSENFM